MADRVQVQLAEPSQLALTQDDLDDKNLQTFPSAVSSVVQNHLYLCMYS